MRIGALAGVALAFAACSGSGEDKPDARTTAAIYAAVVRVLATGNDLPSPLGHVFVEEGELTPEQQTAILHELADLPPVEFVGARGSVLVDENVCPRVQENGVLITLGPISRDSERVTVPGDIFVACLSGLSATFVLEQEGDEWRVTGTEGGIGIS